MATGRRGFLKTMALASEAAQTARAQAGAGRAELPQPARLPFPYRRTFTGRQLEMISFPLGGVAAGCIGLGGRGQLRDWQIYNRPDYGRSANYAFPAIWAQVGNRTPVV